eukprot:TRINITY_DN42320_c0_g1_i1.p1 TRINITY_DN42320_c0_g1~~TRINITY_DN42320_c0_g1_i1.p1  ORF type:complete len:627 (+),score=156.07 TRINITY_DN42320_c0_g1_i1:36-1883(+)
MAPRSCRAADAAPTSQVKAQFSSILCILDDAEEAARSDLASLPKNSNSGLGTASALVQDVAALQSRMSLLEVEVGEKKQIIDTLKRALFQARERESRWLHDTATQCEDKLQKQRTQFESGLHQHQALLEKATREKAELACRCEKLSEELKAVQRKCRSRIEEVEDQASKNIARQKHSWAVCEKQRREAWEKDKVKEIKSMTIKGLEPEVERLLAERKEERGRLEERHREALDTLRRELLQVNERQVREAREQSVREHEQALDKDREKHRQHVQEEHERFTVQIQKERAKAVADLLQESEKVERACRENASAFQAKRIADVAAEHARAEVAIEKAKSNERAAEERFRSETSVIQARMIAEKERWKCEQSERTQADMGRVETVMREAQRAEVARDKQLDEMALRVAREKEAFRAETALMAAEARSEADAHARQFTSEMEDRQRQMKSLESQRARLETTVSNLRRECAEEHDRVECAEARVRALEADKVALEEETHESSKRHEDEILCIKKEGEEEAEALRQEMALLDKCLDEERGRRQAQSKEARRREEAAVAEARRHGEEAISELGTRARQAAKEKDASIGELKAQCAASASKVREFERLLARQREELLNGITTNL